jgi:glutamyl-tRNA synthetase
MSKRNGAIPVIEYLNRGYLPAALLNAICLCGWNPGTEQELFTRDELEKVFDLDHVQKGGAIFNEEKLNWFNREYMKKMSSEELKTGIMKFLPDQFKNLSDEIMNKLIPIIAERINYFGEVQIMIDDGELDYYINTPEINLEKLSWKGEGNDKAKIHLEKTIELLDSVSESDWNSETVKNTIWSYAEESGRGNVLWPMRFALSGRDKSPDPFTLADILGKETTLGRLKQVINQI